MVFWTPICSRILFGSAIGWRTWSAGAVAMGGVGLLFSRPIGAAWQDILAGGSDNAGYPNGRRPKDDVVDISLVAVMGGLCMANGNTNALGFGADCNPSKVPLGATAFKLHDDTSMQKTAYST